MKKRNFFVLPICMTLFVSFVIFSACGKKEDSQAPELGVDGYVYVAESFSPAGQSEEAGVWYHVKSYNGYVYYVFQQVICRMALTEEGQPGETEVVAALNGTAMTLLDYTVDEEGAVYILSGDVQAWTERDEQTMKGSLLKLLSDGTSAYQLSLSEIPLAANSGGGNLLALGSGHELYLLAADGIYLFGPDGKADGRIATEACLPGGSGKEDLVESENGKVYYCVSGILNGAGYEMTLYEVLKGQGGRLAEEMTGSDQNMGGRIVGSPYGILYLNRGNLAQYRQESNAFQNILRMQDSNLYDNVSEMTQISESRFLVCTVGESEEEWYFLTKTPVDEIPPKEILVLASVAPSSNLTTSITRFNRASSRYHVIVETFDGAGWQERLDARIVSSDPPDLLDMSSRLDVQKYADKQGLEDLMPYLESSELLNPEIIQESILDGYTINGRLVCIPSRFRIRALIGRSAQIGTEKGWTMEGLQKTLEEYPRLVPLQQIYGYDSLFGNILVNICADYLLEQFVDWNAGECHFQDEEFLAFMEWLAEYSRKKEQVSYDNRFVSDELLLLREEIGGIGDILNYEILFDEEITMKGFPTVSGDPFYYGVPEDAVGILAGSKEKEGAWSFLEYFLTRESAHYYSFPCRKDLLEDMLGEEMTPEYRRNDDGEIIIDQNGEPVEKPKGGVVIDGETYYYYAATQEQTDRLLDMVAHTRFSVRSTMEQDILAIIQEEMSYYVDQKKTLRDVTDIIQNRVSVLLNER